MVSHPTGCSTYSISYTLKGLSRHVNIFKDTSNGTERSSFFPFRFELTVDQLVLDSRRTLKDIMGGSEKKKNCNPLLYTTENVFYRGRAA